MGRNVDVGKLIGEVDFRDYLDALIGYLMIRSYECKFNKALILP